MVQLTVQMPPGFNNRTTSMEIDSSTSVSRLIQEVLKNLDGLSWLEYELFFAESPSQRWLDGDKTLSDYAIDEQKSVELELKTRQQRACVWCSSSVKEGSVKSSILLDVSKPLSLFLRYVQKKFGLKYGILNYELFYRATMSVLPADKSIIELDMAPPFEMVVVQGGVPVSKESIDCLKRSDSFVNFWSRLSKNAYLDKKKRWLVYEKGQLLSYRSSEEEQGKALESLLLSNFYVAFDEKDKKKCSIELTSVDLPREVHSLRFNTEEDAEVWISFLKTTCRSDAMSHVSESDLPSLYFGAPIEKVRPPGRYVPYLVERCIEWLTEHALTIEGIFRLSGSQTEINSIRAKYNKGELVDIESVGDAHTISGLLKCYFRDLPEPLLKYEHYDAFLSAQEERDPNKRIHQLRELIARLPMVNRETLKYLIEFLSRVENHSEQNKMALHNLATVFAPNLIHIHDKDDMIRIVQDTPLVNGLVSTLIRDYERIFSEEPTVMIPTSAKVVQAYVSQNQNQLSLFVDDVVNVYDPRTREDWWYGELDGNFGIFPSNHVQLLVNRKQQFLAELQQVKDKVSSNNKQIEVLEARKATLTSDVKTLKTLEKSIRKENKKVLRIISSLLDNETELQGVHLLMDQLSAHFDAYDKKKKGVQMMKIEMAEELIKLKNLLVSEAKYRKVKDRGVNVIDVLLEKFSHEQLLREEINRENKQLNRNLKKVRAFFGKSSANSTTPS